LEYNDIQATMFYYADLGLPVIPLCPADEAEHNKTSAIHRKSCKCRGKIPLIAGWRTRVETTKEEVTEWYRQWPAANIGMPLGDSGYVGIDIDGPEGEEFLKEMAIDENGKVDLPETWEFSTGAGRRLLYRIPIGMKTKKVKQTGEAAHNECAFLCSGQQTVLPPSKHFTGKTYQWVDGRSPDVSDCAMAPRWLVDLIRKPEQYRLAYGYPNKQAELKVAKEEEYIFDLTKIGNEFDSEEFDDSVPAEVIENRKNTGNSITARTAQALQNDKKSGDNPELVAKLFKVIPEGSRDDTMTQIIGYFLSKKEYRSMPQDFFMEFILNYNMKYCDPPIEEESIRAKVNTFWEIEQQKSAKYKSMHTKRDWIVSEVIQIILNKLDDMNLAIKFDTVRDQFYYSSRDKGPWKLDTDGFIEAKMWSIMISPEFGDPSWGSQYHLREVKDAIKLYLRDKGLAKGQLFDMNLHRDELANYIVVDGKLLNWRTKELLAWDTNYNATVNFDVNYDSEAECPNWEHYMEQWLPNEAMRNILQEFMGSCLLPEPAPEEKFIILTGAGSNGKTMFLKGMQQIFKDFSVALTPQKLAERFGSSALYGKLVNICSEIEGDGGFLKNTAQLKAIVSGESLNAEFKGKDTFKFEPVANLIFSCNKVPRTKDKSDGWYRRQMIIPFTEHFSPNSVIGYEMVKNMEEEKTGIFNWLLEGLRRIKARGYFIIPKELKEVQHVFKASNDPIEGFINDCLVKKSADKLQKDYGLDTSTSVGTATTIIQELYQVWCKYSYGDKDQVYRRSPRAFNQELASRGVRKVRGMCVHRNAKTAIFENLDLNIDNTELYEIISEDYVACSVNEPGFYLREYVRKAEKELKKPDNETDK